MDKATALKVRRDLERVRSWLRQVERDLARLSAGMVDGDLPDDETLRRMELAYNLTADAATVQLLSRYKVLGLKPPADVQLLAEEAKATGLRLLDGGDDERGT